MKAARDGSDQEFGEGASPAAARRPLVEPPGADG
jgi:hypothetical protein